MKKAATEVPKVMDATLKAKLTETAEAYFNQNFKEGTFQTYPGFYAFLRKRMKNARKWQPLEAALASERIAQLFAERARKWPRARPADPAQLALFADFAHLPQSVRVGNHVAGKKPVPLRDLTVPQFLDYKEGYELRAGKRTGRNQKVLDELRRLAEQVGRFKAEGITVAEALMRTPRIERADAAGA